MILTGQAGSNHFLMLTMLMSLALKSDEGRTTGLAGWHHMLLMLMLMSTMMMSKALKSDKGRTGLAVWHHKATEKSSGTN